MTQELAVQRNRFVAALADEIIFGHITPGGSLEELRRLVTEWDIANRSLSSGEKSDPGIDRGRMTGCP